MRARTVLVMSANASFAVVVTSPTTCTWPVVTSVSTATRDLGSSREQRVEHRVADGVTDLVGVPLGHRLTGKQPTFAHGSILSLSLSRKLVSQIISCHVALLLHPSVRPRSRATLTRRRMRAFGSPAAVVQEGHDRVHDTAGHQSLRTVLQRDLGAVGRQQPSVVVVHLERPVLADGVDDEQIAALALQFGAGVEQHVAVRVAGLGGEPDDGPHVGQLTVRARPHRAGEHVVGAGELDRRRRGFGVAAFLILLVATCAGRKSATAAAITSTCASGACLETASRSWAAEPMWTTSTPAGSIRPAVLPAISVTSAPRWASDPGHRVALLARAAVADEPHRVDAARGCRLRVTSTLTPARSYGSASPRSSSSWASVVISSASGSRPAPVSAPVSRPDAGSSTIAPRRRNVATLSTVAG